VVNYQYSTVVPWMCVIGQLPAAGTQILYQSVGVQLTVSLGYPNPLIVATVPNLVGLQYLDALTALVRAKLNIGTITWVIGPQPIASVTLQSIAPLTVVAPFTAVNITVCSGPPQDFIMNDTQIVPLVH